MTAKYIAETNELQELSDYEQPPDRPNPKFYSSSQIDIYQRHLEAWQIVMQGHSASKEKYEKTLRRIPCSPECRGLWKPGDKLEEGKDYEVREISKYQRPVGAKNLRVTSHKNKLDLPEPLRSTLAAYPIITNAQQPCFWVKASDRLPKYLGEPRVVKIDGLPSAGNFENDENGNLCFYVTWGHEWVVAKDKFAGIEWLDEPAFPLPVKSEEDLWREVFKIIEAHTSNNERAVISDASAIGELKSKYSLTKR